MYSYTAYGRDWNSQSKLINLHVWVLVTVR